MTAMPQGTVSHTAANRRLAKKLGVKLPTLPHGAASLPSRRYLDSASYGRDELTFGKPKSKVKRTVRRTEFGWVVVLKGRTVTETADLPTAKAVARWLGFAENRRTFRGLGPKGQRELVSKTEGLDEEAGLALLKAELTRVNSGAVRVR